MQKRPAAFALLTQYDQLFHGQKTDKSRTETLKNVLRRQRLIRQKDRRGPCILGCSAGLFCQHKEKYCAIHRKTQQKTSAFLPHFKTRKDPVSSDRVLVVCLNKKDILAIDINSTPAVYLNRSSTSITRRIFMIISSDRSDIVYGCSFNF